MSALEAPTRADYSDEGIACTDAFRQDLDEIFSKLDIVDVEKNAFASQSSREAIINAAREAAGIVSPIADEDAARHPSPALHPQRLMTG